MMTPDLRTRFWRELCDWFSIGDTSWRVDWLEKWFEVERAQGLFNPLGAGVWGKHTSFQTLEVGVEATAKQLLDPRFSLIRSALVDESYDETPLHHRSITRQLREWGARDFAQVIENGWHPEGAGPAAGSDANRLDGIEASLTAMMQIISNQGSQIAALQAWRKVHVGRVHGNEVDPEATPIGVPAPAECSDGDACAEAELHAASYASMRVGAEWRVDA